MEDFHDFEKRKIISFSNRTKLIQFVSKYLAYKYKEYLESRIEYLGRVSCDYWEQEIKRHLKLERALRKLLKKSLKANTKIDITPQSEILIKAFEKANIFRAPLSCFDLKVRYEIDNLVFKKRGRYYY